MKTIKLILAIMAISISSTVFSANKTETIKVSGNCESCKARIEKAVKVKGVAKAVWSEKTNLLTVVYDPTKISTDDIEKRIVAVGHDTPNYKSSTATYNALPACCKYR